MMLLTREFSFSAAHTLQRAKGEEGALHGHNYEFRITVKGDPEDGMVVDVNELSDLVEEKVVRALDKKNLNDILDIPTMENIALWVWDRLKNDLPLYEVRVWEWRKKGSSAIFREG